MLIGRVGHAEYFLLLSVYHLERTETGRLRFMDVTEVSERQMGDMVRRASIQHYELV